MELKLSFNEDVINYDRWRPNYVEALFNDVIDHTSINNTSKLLEIGVGTGQATLPFLKLHCQIDGIELGNRLAEYTKLKFKTYSNLNIINADFEFYSGEANSYDLIYSATAFHWINEELGLIKAFNLLKDNGWIALFWNHPFVSRKDDSLHQEIQKVYDKYWSTNEKIVEFKKDDCRVITNKLLLYGFSNVISKLYYQKRTFNSDDYISLLNTYSDHRCLALPIKNRFENEIRSVIKENNDQIIVYDTIDLYLGQKKQ